MVSTRGAYCANVANKGSVRETEGSGWEREGEERELYRANVTLSTVGTATA